MQNQKLSKDAVAQAALEILDELGLPDLTMRRLASELGVQPSALYWYFPNKQSLLADLADRIVNRKPTGAALGDWDAQLRLVAYTLRNALLAYRDSAEVVSSTLALGIGENPAQSRLCQALASSPFDARTVRRAAETMLHFTLGHVSLEQQRMQYDGLGVRAGEPLILRDQSSEEDFYFGVETLIFGLQQRAHRVSSA